MFEIMSFIVLGLQILVLTTGFVFLVKDFRNKRKDDNTPPFEAKFEKLIEQMIEEEFKKNN